MTGYTVHTGSSEKFTTGWDHIFSQSGTTKKSAAAGKKAQRKTKTAKAKASAKRKAAGK